MKRIKDLFQNFYVKILSITLVIILLLNFVFIPGSINGGSMLPTLKQGQRGMSFIITKYFGINRFDVCAINVNNEKFLVKRVIGFPNEKIEYINNELYIDGIKMEENFLKKGTITEDVSITLGEDEYYILGDHRETSKDSREYGPFCKDDIVATHYLILYPFNEIGFVK